MSAVKLIVKKELQNLTGGNDKKAKCTGAPEVTNLFLVQLVPPKICK